MTVIVRSFASIPARSAMETWEAVVNLLTHHGTDPQEELQEIAGIACSLITRETMRSSPIIIHGGGPRLRIYCIYGEDAITADDSDESKLHFNPTAGNWAMSLPCPKEELEWIQAALSRKSKRVTARDQNEKFDADAGQHAAATGAPIAIDEEAFFRS